MINFNKSQWDKVLLRDVVTKKEENDKDKAKSTYDRFLKVEHLDARSLHIKRWASQESGDQLPPTFYKIFRKGQMLFPTRNPHLKRSALASFDGICGEKTLTLEAIESHIIPEFLPFLFHSDSFYEHTTSMIVGSTNPHVRWRDVEKFQFQLPKIKEQKAIAELLWSAEKNQQKLVKLLESLVVLKDTISSKIFCKRVKQYIEELPFDLDPEEFQSFSLENLCDLITDGAHKSPPTYEGGLPIATVENMKGSSFDLKKCRTISPEDHEDLTRNNCMPLSGDVMFSKDGTIGKTFVFNQKEKIVLLSSIAIIRPQKELLNPYFCSLMLESPAFFQEIEKRKSGTALKRVVLKDIKKFKVLIPNLYSQNIIAEYLGDINKRISVVKENIEHFQKLKSGIVNKVF